MRIPISSSQLSLNFTWMKEKQFQGGYKEAARGRPLSNTTREDKSSLTLQRSVLHVPHNTALLPLVLQPVWPPLHLAPVLSDVSALLNHTEENNGEKQGQIKDPMFSTSFLV